MCLHLAQRRRRGGGKAHPGCEMKISPTPSSSGTKHRRHFCAVGRAQGSNLGTVLMLRGRCSSSWLVCRAECPKLRAQGYFYSSSLLQGTERWKCTVLSEELETTALQKGKEAARSLCPTFTHFHQRQQKAQLFG